MDGRIWGPQTTRGRCLSLRQPISNDPDLPRPATRAFPVRDWAQSQSFARRVCRHGALRCRADCCCAECCGRSRLVESALAGFRIGAPGQSSDRATAAACSVPAATVRARTIGRQALVRRFQRRPGVARLCWHALSYPAEGKRPRGTSAVGEWPALHQRAQRNFPDRTQRCGRSRGGPCEDHNWRAPSPVPAALLPWPRLPPRTGRPSSANHPRNSRSPSRSPAPRGSLRERRGRLLSPRIARILVRARSRRQPFSPFLLSYRSLSFSLSHSCPSVRDSFRRSFAFSFSSPLAL